MTRAQETDGSVRAFCLRILGSGDLGTKLAPPAAELADRDPGGPPPPDAPARAPGLALAAGAEPLPRSGALGAPEARARVLARLAHHELMAVELFAWALLRWPELPAPLRRALVAVLADEQRHCKMYLGRLGAHGSSLCEHPRSGYLWKHVPAVSASRAGPRAFLCAMGLTFEQANLDFSLVYRDAFRTAGDAASARVCQAVHDDEVVHVRLAAQWLRRLGGPGARDVDAYREAVPFPLGAARAKGRRFDAAARRRAGLSEAFIDHVRRARSTQERARERSPEGASR